MSMRPSLRQLDYFVRIAEAGSYRGAAEQLGMSQPPLTQQMQVLEARLETALFDRSGRRMKLTAAGEKLLVDARRILADVDQSCAAVQAVDRGLSGLIRIGMTDDFVASPIIAQLAQFLRTNEGIQVDASIGVSTELLHRMELAELDVMLGSPLPSRHPEVVQRALPSSPIRLLVTDGHRLASRASVQVADLVDEAFIFIPARYRSPFATRCEAILAQANIVPRVAHYAVNEAIAAQLARHGCGVTLASEGSISTPLTGIRAIAIDDPLASLDQALFVREPASPVVLRLIDHICSDIGNGAR